MKLSEGTQNFLVNNASSKTKRASKLKRAWEHIAPEVVLEHSDNVADSTKRNGGLTVYVDDAKWAAQLSMNSEFYRQAFQYVLDENVPNIYFVVSKNTGIRKQFEKKSELKPWYIDESKPEKLTNQELEQAKKAVEKVNNPKLKESLFKAYVADLEWKKGLEASKTS